MIVRILSLLVFTLIFSSCHGQQTATTEEKAFEALDKLKDLNLDEKRLKDIKEESDFVMMLKEALKA